MVLDFWSDFLYLVLLECITYLDNCTELLHVIKSHKICWFIATGCTLITNWYRFKQFWFGYFTKSQRKNSKSTFSFCSDLMQLAQIFFTIYFSIFFPNKINLLSTRRLRQFKHESARIMRAFIHRSDKMQGESKPFSMHGDRKNQF